MIVSILDWLNLSLLLEDFKFALWWKNNIIWFNATYDSLWKLNYWLNLSLTFKMLKQLLFRALETCFELDNPERILRFFTHLDKRKYVAYFGLRLILLNAKVTWVFEVPDISLTDWNFNFISIISIFKKTLNSSIQMELTSTEAIMKTKIVYSIILIFYVWLVHEENKFSYFYERSKINRVCHQQSLFPSSNFINKIP
jgi:hypothetical protein